MPISNNMMPPFLVKRNNDNSKIMDQSHKKSSNLCDQAPKYNSRKNRLFYEMQVQR